FLRARQHSGGPFANHARRIDVGIVSKPTVPTTKRLTVALPGLDMPTSGTGGRSVRWANHLDSNALNRCKNEHALAKETRRVLLPTDQAFRVLKCHASSRPPCH